MRVLCRVDTAHAKHAHLSVYPAGDGGSVSIASVVVNRPELKDAEIERLIAAGEPFEAELTIPGEGG